MCTILLSVGVSKNRDTVFWDLYNEDFIIGGIIIGPPVFGASDCVVYVVSCILGRSCCVTCAMFCVLLRARNSVCVWAAGYGGGRSWKKKRNR